MAAAFGTTWWGQAWLDAFEAIAGGRGSRLARGRRWAREHRAEDIALDAGGVQAFVQGDRPDPFEARVVVRPLRDDEWEAVFDAIAAKAAHAAALLDGELDPAVVEDAATVEVDLLPRPRDLSTVCSCPDEVEPCEHAAAVCYLLAAALDADPFVLLHVRGRTREQVLDEVRRRRSGSRGRPEAPTDDAGPAPADGVDPAEAWARTPGPLPSVPAVANRPGRAAAWPSDPPAHAPFDGRGLRALAGDAARRAWELAAGSTETGLELDLHADLARRAVGARPFEREQLAARADLTPVDLEQAATAYDLAGAPGVRMLQEGSWSPPPLEMAAARDAIESTGMASRRVLVRGNRIMVDGRIQFRRSRDGGWYLFTKDTGRWTLAGPPGDDVEELFDLLGAEIPDD